jgi:HlyD family secretion protein
MMKFLVKFVLPAVAAAAFVVAVMHVIQTNRETGARPKPVGEPPRSPFKDAVAGSGIVEAETENIAVGSPVPGVVEKVFVKVGKPVKAGNPLFKLITVELEAQWSVKKAAVLAAKADFYRLKNLPRREEVPLKEAAVKDAAARLAESQRKLKRLEEAFRMKAITEDDVEGGRLDVATATAGRDKAVADLKLLKAGTSEDQLNVAKAAIQQAEADAAQIEADLKRRTIVASVDGEVLQVNVRPGEYVGAPPNQALVLIGNTQQLHVRVDIDEADIPRFRPGSDALAMLKGYPEYKFPLKFRRVEPYVIPKKSLTGENTERIDTRVLQVIYEIGQHDTPLYVGQQMDVFIKARPAAKR